MTEVSQAELTPTPVGEMLSKFASRKLCPENFGKRTMSSSSPNKEKGRSASYGLLVMVFVQIFSIDLQPVESPHSSGFFSRAADYGGGSRSFTEL